MAICSGAEVVSEPQIGAAGRPDLLVWLSGASSSLGSPLVIEIKQTGANAPFESLAQIGRYMRALNARTGILAINQPGDLIQVSVVEGGFVFSLSPEHLLNLISSDKLLSQLIERRNACAHGGN